MVEIYRGSCYTWLPELGDCKSESFAYSIKAERDYKASVFRKDKSNHVRVSDQVVGNQKYFWVYRRYNDQT